MKARQVSEGLLSGWSFLRNKIERQTLRKNTMKLNIQNLYVYVVVMCVFLLSCTTNSTYQKDGSKSDKFSFVFMTDVHLQPNHNYRDLPLDYEFSPGRAFSMAIDTANQLGADFAIIGGDMIFDATRGQDHADALYQMYISTKQRFAMPVYDVIGNHDLFGVHETSNVGQDNPDYNYGMYERFLGDTYYSFEHKGWFFIVLNSVSDGKVQTAETLHDRQKVWLQELLSNLDKNTPIVMALHIPLVSVRNQIHPTGNDQSQSYTAVLDKNEILDMFRNHNLRLVLQGHSHFVEDIYVHEIDTRFLSGGAVSGRPTWRGFRYGPPGFLSINIKEDDSISWDFIDYGWMDVIGKPSGWESQRR
jgi:3',5'-cyclic-AMP phosphodiesterase